MRLRSDPSRSQPQPPEKPCPRKPSSPGRPAFQALIEQAGHPRWNARPPQLIIKRQGLSPWWSPALWLAHRPSAWSAWNCVIVSEEMLKRPPNRYLLAHELGHLHHLHHAQYQATSLAILLCASLLYAYGPAASLAIKLLGLALILALGLRLIELCSLKAEFQADAFAARLIGAEEVAKGIQAHARKTKRRDLGQCASSPCLAGRAPATKNRLSGGVSICACGCRLCRYSKARLACAAALNRARLSSRRIASQ